MRFVRFFGNHYQKQAQNPSNPFATAWVESGQLDPNTNRFNSGVTYDDAGNITVDSKFRNLQFQYDANNRQKQSAQANGSGAVVSVYDAGGQRVATQVGGSLTNILVYDAGGKLVAEYGSPAGGGTQYLFSDQQGSPRVVTSSSGALVSRHDYAPFGEEIGGVGMRTSGQGYGGADARQKYAGMETDDATGMDHTLWRQYDSSSGRWTAPDPYGGSMSVASPQSFNRYSYVDNDPVNRRDPSGLMQQEPGGEPGSWNSKDDPAGDPFETGRSIIAEAEARFDQAVTASMEYNRSKDSGSNAGQGEIPGDSQVTVSAEITSGAGIVVALYTGAIRKSDADIFEARAKENSDVSMLFNTGQEMIAAAALLSKEIPIAILKVFDHGFPAGIIGSNQNNTGLYIENIHDQAYKGDYYHGNNGRHNIDVRDYINLNTGEAKYRTSGAATARNLVDAIVSGRINIAVNGKINLYGCRQDDLASHLATLLNAGGRGDITVSGAKGDSFVAHRNAPKVDGGVNSYRNGVPAGWVRQWKY